MGRATSRLKRKKTIWKKIDERQQKKSWRRLTTVEVHMSATTHVELLAEGLERISDAARFLGVSRSLVYRLMNAGVLPSVRIGRNRRLPIKAVRELALNNLVGPPSCDGR
jgi:excisionase family DNA binding protein